MTGVRRDKRERLDVILVDRGLAETRVRAQALILAGRVMCGTDRLTKPGHRYDPAIEIAIEPGRRFVSRGALKLEAAITSFGIAVAGREALDVGASTGGFTEVLLRHGARRVIALDVGRGQLDWSLRRDDRVVVVEGVNARYLTREDLPCAPELVTVDVSFISLDLILPAATRVMAADRNRDLVTLVKPQFEVGRGGVGRGGIVRDPEQHREVLENAIARGARLGFPVVGLTASPIAGAEGNREFLLHMSPDLDPLDRTALDRAVGAALVSPPKEKENP